jgi:hypothetical protein
MVSFSGGDMASRAPFRGATGFKASTTVVKKLLTMGLRALVRGSGASRSRACLSALA